ncbi:MAG: hypothetical protein WBB31_01545 [Saprospiraceae bacterium]
MKFRHLFIALIISPFLLQGLCNKEDAKLTCTEVVTWDGSAKDGFYQSVLQDSHFRDLYFEVRAVPTDICPDTEIRAFFKVTSAGPEFIHNVNRIEGKIIWGDQEEKVKLEFSSVQEYAYIGTIESIDLKPYFDAHPTADGTAVIAARFFWYNLSVGTEKNDLKYVTDNVVDMNVQVQYVRK